jgi:hypothetical protein
VLFKLQYEVTYLGPEGAKSGRSTQAVSHTKQNAFIFKIATQKQKSIEICSWQEDGPPLANRILCLSDCTSPWYIDPHTHGILTPLSMVF